MHFFLVNDIIYNNADLSDQFYEKIYFITFYIPNIRSDIKMGFFSLFKTKKEEEITKTEQENMGSVSLIDEFSLEPSTESSSDLIINQDEPKVNLSSLEKNFLKYMDLKDSQCPYIADYWKFEYNLNAKELISNFLKNNLLAISDYSHNLNLLKNKDLKCILKKYNLPQTGIKAELIGRIEAHLSEKELASLSNLKPYYYLTERGLEIIKDLPFSATKDPDFEDICVQSILNEDYQSAYKNICKREIHKNVPRNIGLNWGHELQSGLRTDYTEKLSEFFSSSLPDDLPVDNISQQAREIKAAVIFGNLLRLTSSETAALIARRTGLDPKKSHLNVLCQKLYSCI